MHPESSEPPGKRRFLVPAMAALLAAYQLFLLSRAPEQWVAYGLSFAGLALLVPLSYMAPKPKEGTQHPALRGLYTLAFALVVVGLVFRFR